MAVGDDADGCMAVGVYGAVVDESIDVALGSYVHARLGRKEALDVIEVGGFEYDQDDQYFGSLHDWRSHDSEPICFALLTVVLDCVAVLDLS